MTTIILQPTPACNLNCSYCYLPGRDNHGIMSSETLANAFGKLLDSELPADAVTVVWHAGEPLLAGLGFFANAVALASRYSTGRRIQHSLQTNGTLLTANWARFFADNDFAVGVSIDGPAFIHDACRQNWSGAPSHRSVMCGVEELRRQGINPAALAVIRRGSMAYADEIFSFFSREHFEQLAFNVEERENANKRTSWDDAVTKSVIEEEYSAFVRQLFRRWRAEGERIWVREFASTLRRIERALAGCAAEVPDDAIPLRIVTIQYNGDVSTFAPELAGAVGPGLGRLVIGNINRDPLESIINSESLRRMRAAVTTGGIRCGATCPYFSMCGGGFTANRLFENGSFESTETLACRLHRQVLTRVLMEELAA